MTLRVHLQARIADLLWEHDEQLARKRFEEVFRVIGPAKAREEDCGNSTRLVSYYDRPICQLRSEVLDLLARRDADWAKRIALTTLEAKRPYLDAHVLMNLLDTDPQRAAVIMKRDLDSDDITTLREFLMKLRHKEPALADGLFSTAISRAERESKNKFDFFFEVFEYAFPDPRHVEGEDSDRSVKDIPPLVDSPVSYELITRFLAFGFKALMGEADSIEKEGPDRSINERSGFGYMSVQRMLPAFDKYAPESAVKIRARWDEVIGRLRGGKRHVTEVHLLSGKAGVQELLSEVEKARTLVEKGSLYGLAAMAALSEGNEELASSLLRKVPNLEGQEQWKQRFYEEASKKTLARGDLTGAYSYAKRLEDLGTRVSIFSRLIQALSQRGEGQKATAMLNEIEQAIVRSNEGRERVLAYLSIAGVASVLDSERGFALMTRAVFAINEEYPVTAAQPTSLWIDDFDKSLSVLARTDFDRALSLSKKLSSRTNLVIAQAAVCRGVLRKDDPIK